MSKNATTLVHKKFFFILIIKIWISWIEKKIDLREFWSFIGFIWRNNFVLRLCPMKIYSCKCEHFLKLKSDMSWIVWNDDYGPWTFKTNIDFHLRFARSHYLLHLRLLQFQVRQALFLGRTAQLEIVIEFITKSFKKLYLNNIAF